MKPRSWLWRTLTQWVRQYHQGVFAIDEGVGRVMKALEETGQVKNTLVIFTSDNGPWFNFGNNAGSTGGLREGKGTSFEGGQRVPCIMRWKGKIPAGSECQQITGNIDVLNNSSVSLQSGKSLSR